MKRKIRGGTGLIYELGDPWQSDWKSVGKSESRSADLQIVDEGFFDSRILRIPRIEASSAVSLVMSPPFYYLHK